ncbi:MAG: hypothetical protein ACYS22_21350 [Planctomycetota bacterium]|jgi:hypothetical protein
MTPQSVLTQAEADGVRLYLSGGTVKAKGEPATIDRWLPILRERKADIQTALAEKQLSALAAVKASNVRMARHQGQRIIAFPAANDTPQLRDALDVLGYGGCTVLHLETKPLRGKSSQAIAEAIEVTETEGEQ